VDPQIARLAAVRPLDALQIDLLQRIDDLDRRVATTLVALVSNQKIVTAAVADLTPHV
jgi:hypothetical protein